MSEKEKVKLKNSVEVYKLHRKSTINSRWAWVCVVFASFMAIFGFVGDPEGDMTQTEVIITSIFMIVILGLVATHLFIKSRKYYQQELSKIEDETELKYRNQMSLYHIACRWRNTSYFTFSLAGFFIFMDILVIILSFTSGEPIKDWGRFILGMLIIIGISGGLAFGGYKILMLSKKRFNQLEEVTKKEGDYYHCACGKEKKKYSWIQVVLSIILFPWGLISLFFEAKKCRECGKEYENF